MDNNQIEYVVTGYSFAECVDKLKPYSHLFVKGEPITVVSQKNSTLHTGKARLHVIVDEG